MLVAKPLPALLAASEADTPQGVADLRAWQAAMLSANGSAFDGAIIDLGFRREAASGAPLVAADFAEEVAVVRAVAAAGKTQNFQILNLNALPLDWRDDAAFAAIESNFETAATLVEQAQMPGFLIDNQMYGPSAFAVTPGDEAGFAQLEQIVRARGDALAAAFIRGFPHVQLMFAWAYAEMFRSLCLEGGMLQTHPYALYPAFLEGVQNAIMRAGTNAKLIDGFLPAYPARQAQDFQVFRALVNADHAAVERGWHPQIVSHWDDLGQDRGPVKWPDEYRLRCDPQTATRLKVPLPSGFGLMVDYDMDGFAKAVPAELPRHSATALAPAIMAAMQAADTYVWLYTAAGSWWRDTADGRVSLGIVEAVRSAKQQLADNPLAEVP